MSEEKGKFLNSEGANNWVSWKNLTALGMILLTLSAIIYPTITGIVSAKETRDEHKADISYLQIQIDELKQNTADIKQIGRDISAIKRELEIRSGNRYSRDTSYEN